MSRAFVKEGDGALDPLPDLPLSPHPNYVTPRGLAALQVRLRDLQITLAGLKRKGAGVVFLAEVARLAEAPVLYLAVLEANPRGRTFWQRMGFRATGKTGRDAETGHVLHRLMKAL